MEADIFSDGKNKLTWYKTGIGKPLLILHGWGSSSKVMQPLAEKLKQVRTSFLVDLPGFGNSPEPATAWSVDDYADIIERFIEEIFSGQKIDLLVHSFGARIAIKLLSRPAVSSNIEKVIFTGAAGIKPKRKPSYYFKKYTAKTLKLPFYLLPGSLREKGLNKLRNTGLWKRLGSSDYQKLSGVMRETFVKSVTEYLDEDLKKIEHEILLLWGENDTATPPEQGRRMKKSLKNATLIVIEGASHYAFLDKPTQFSAILKAYLEPGA